MAQIIEYNDWQLRQFSENGEPVYAQMAGASTASGELQFGASAWTHARSHPQQFNARFLTSLSAEPVQADMGVAKNLADLVYHQLKLLDTHKSNTIIAVPGYLTDEQLGLLLGICQQADIQVAGFVDLGLAYALTESRAHPAAVLDVELHRLVLTELTLQNDKMAVRACRNLDGAGLMNVLDGWMNLVADNFVHQTRFDPLHTGDTEQQLLNQLTRWFEQGQITSRIAIGHNDVLREVDLQPHVVQDKLTQRIEPVLNTISGAGTPLLVTPRAQAIPGLVDVLRAHGIQCLLTSADWPSPGLRQLSALLADDEVIRLSEAPLLYPDTAIEPDAATGAPAFNSSPSPNRTATHLLHDHVAYSVEDARFASLDTQQLQPGQVVTILEQAYTAIEVI